MAVLWLALPFAMLWIVKPHHGSNLRYFSFMQPVYILMVGVGLVAAGRWMTQRVDASDGHDARHCQWWTGCAATVAVTGVVVVALVVPTWHSYQVEKLNDWKAVCADRRSRVPPGDAITGDSYTPGILNRC
ncbi:MAG TPA: hypothetical protein VMS64_15310 [Candidatus Methylomirabilis sp.]|nr:hypothetical protein [Candidatus Methylomirabilis sp.]